jgi:hypothetical protein
MSTKQPGHDDTTAQTDTLVTQAAPLSPLEALRAGAEALHRALETSEAIVEERWRGRVEAESHRISEEVTRQAQDRLRAQTRTPTAAPTRQAPARDDA